jgi:hypothetical protein
VDRSEAWRPDLAMLPYDKGRIAKLRRLVAYRLRRFAPARG